MKEVYILRHANWNNSEDTLLPEGIENAKERSVTLPRFTVAYASPFIRTQQTAELLSHLKPKIIAQASIPEAPSEIRSQILERRATHPFGIAGALFETPQAWPALQTAGNALATLIKDTLAELDDEEKALIVSHDGTMVAARRILSHTDIEQPLEYTYGELEGFKINEKMIIEDIRTSIQGQ
jgi:broad specificity phosphatase PhoE